MQKPISTAFPSLRAGERGRKGAKEGSERGEIRRNWLYPRGKPATSSKEAHKVSSKAIRNFQPPRARQRARGKKPLVGNWRGSADGS